MVHPKFLTTVSHFSAFRASRLDETLEKRQNAKYSSKSGGAVHASEGAVHAGRGAVFAKTLGSCSLQITNKHTQTHTNTHKHTQPHTNIHKHTQTHTQTHTNIHKHTQTHTNTHNHTHTQTHTNTHKHTHTQTHTNTHKNTQTQFASTDDAIGTVPESASAIGNFFPSIQPPE